MRRGVIALAWIAAATVPLVLAAVFIFGCCVLPFHSVVHRLMPLCEMAAQVLRGEQDDDARSSAPARGQQEPVKRITTQAPAPWRLTLTEQTRPNAAPTAAAAYRSFISLGAVRCDQDIGLHVLVDTFRI